MSIRHRTRQLARALATPPAAAPRVGLKIAVVTGTASGVTTVAIGPDSVDVVVRNAAYVPAVDDVVLVLLNGSSPVLLAQLAGVTQAN